MVGGQTKVPNIQDLDDVLVHLLAGCPNNPLMYLVKYGSCRTESDIDLLAIYAQPLGHVDYNIGRLDIFALEKGQFQRLLGVHDPIVTEPLLTGNLLLGDHDRWNGERQCFLDTKPAGATLFHLAMRMMQVMNSAESFLDRFQATNEHVDAFYFLKNLSFALGYLAFVKEYSKGRFPIVLKDVLDAVPVLREINERKTACGQGVQHFMQDELRDMLTEAKRLCLTATIENGAQSFD